MSDNGLSDKIESLRQEMFNGQCDIKLDLERLQKNVISQIHRRCPRNIGRTFPHFSSLPSEIRHRIWDLSIPRRFVSTMSCIHNGSIMQPPPAVAHTCREARTIASRHGGMWKTVSGIMSQWTWFQADRDVVIWTGGGSLCDLPGVVQSIVVARQNLFQSGNAPKTFEALLRAGFHNLKEVYVEVGNHLQAVDEDWSPHVISELFGFEKIVLPNMEHLSLGRGPRISRVLGEEKSTSNMPPETFDYWRDSILDAEHDAPNTKSIEEWAATRSEMQSGWLNAMALLTPGIGLSSVDGQEYPELNRHAMMSSGGLRWQDHFLNRMPEVIPTCGFALLDDRRFW